MFGLIKNTVSGVMEVAVNTAKLPLAIAVEPFTEDSPTAKATERIIDGIDKIGKTDDDD